MRNLKVNNTTAAPNGSTSRLDPDGNCRLMTGSEGHPEQTKSRSLTTPDPFGNSTTNAAYNKLPSIQQSIMPLVSYQSNNPHVPTFLPKQQAITSLYLY